METRPRPRGRPRAGQPDRISELALQLMSGNGYAATTMSHIAAAAGLSEATLFRYFPTKSAVLWHGMEDSARLFSEALAARSSDEPLVDAVFAAYQTMLHSSAVHLAVIKSRIAIVHREPEGNDAIWTQYEHWERMVIQFVAARRSLPVEDLESRVVGAMVWSALWSAISYWAVSDVEDPATIVDGARDFVHLR
jgi:AcrR family transcriptional regulator